MHLGLGRSPCPCAIHAPSRAATPEGIAAVTEGFLAMWAVRPGRRAGSRRAGRVPRLQSGRRSSVSRPQPLSRTDSPSIAATCASRIAVARADALDRAVGHQQQRVPPALAAEHPDQRDVAAREPLALGGRPAAPRSAGPPACAPCACWRVACGGERDPRPGPARREPPSAAAAPPPPASARRPAPPARRLRRHPGGRRRAHLGGRCHAAHHLGRRRGSP